MLAPVGIWLSCSHPPHSLYSPLNRYVNSQHCTGANCLHLGYICSQSLRSSRLTLPHLTICSSLADGLGLHLTTATVLRRKSGLYSCPPVTLNLLICSFKSLLDLPNAAFGWSHIMCVSWPGAITKTRDWKRTVIRMCSHIAALRLATGQPGKWAPGPGPGQGPWGIIRQFYPSLLI